MNCTNLRSVHQYLGAVGVKKDYKGPHPLRSIINPEQDYFTKRM